MSSKKSKSPKAASKSDAPKKASSKPTRRQSWLDRAVRRVFWFFVRLGFRIAAFVALIIGVATTYYYVSLPNVDELFDARAKGSVTMVDRRGEVFAWRGDQFGGEVRPGNVSPFLTKAIMAAEDRRFYSHFGIDPRGLARAMVANARAGRFVQGGSTLTQQVAKNVFLTSERTIERKLKEVPVALALELKYTKDEILAIYLNRVYLGAGATGFEAAAQRYFSKSAREVSLPEAAMLAGLLKAPSRFSPTSNMGRAQGRASVIINAMRETGVITELEAEKALKQPATLSREASRRTGAHFADWVMENGPGFLVQSTTEDVRIQTTFDARVQSMTEAALKHVFDTKVRKGSPAEAAIVVMNHQGQVRAIVGGRDPRANTFNRATQALRQTGSAFKPIVYAAAMEAGMNPNDTIEDRPLTMTIPGSGKWSPKNYSGKYEGAVTLSEALAKSINTVAVRLSEKTGRERVRSLASNLGISSEIANGPAVALGVSEATLIEMTAAYAAFTNGGHLAIPTGIREITIRGDEAPVMTASQTANGAKVISENSAAKLTSMMRRVITSGTGRRADLGKIPAAGKTGTTQAARDAWFIGFTGHYVVGVWMGKDDNAPLIGVTGGGLPAEIWKEVMVRLHNGLSIRPLDAGFSQSGGGAIVGSVDDDDGVVQTIFKEVFDLLSSDSGGSGNGGSSGGGARNEEERIER
ncbi:MAG: transglycosylase domain-containing protein [Paracoccaceae bacterium]|nr:transglycosylase domain-containing protein [Paracoccaceae bacterium]